jgi:hypothetical protein
LWWTGQDGCLGVAGYPLEQEKIVKRNRENGKKGGRPPAIKPNDTSGDKPDGSISVIPDGSVSLKRNSNSKSKGNNYSDEFESAWKSFGGTGTKTVAYRFWQKLSQADRDSVVSRMPAYVASEPDERYRGHFSSWINPDKRKWENKLKAGESTESVVMTPEEEEELFKDYC